jgi:hypothetical protein
MQPKRRQITVINNFSIAFLESSYKIQLIKANGMERNSHEA